MSCILYCPCEWVALQRPTGFVMFLISPLRVLCLLFRPPPASSLLQLVSTAEPLVFKGRLSHHVPAVQFPTMSTIGIEEPSCLLVAKHHSGCYESPCSSPCRAPRPSPGFWATSLYKTQDQRQPNQWSVPGVEGRHKEISPSPQYQPNQTFCTAGEVLLTWCAGLWARAQACHKDRKKTLTVWSYSFEARSRAAADFTFLQAGGPEGK